jgi:hypothetical protein
MNNAINARTEFEDFVKGKFVLCAEVFRTLDSYTEECVIIRFKVGHSFEEFLKELDFEYEPAECGQRLIAGTIWFTDGTWAERDGYEDYGDLLNEFWILKSVPKIPEELKK